ncbi:MAG: hypothetical protein A2297_01840 [Elusimicrobia bacterium RIFOXYB2_FULL_48_7]|nr:MAG: hypothetical protein A2297_01840 [Elusimicrobia bacterium RIFOXYB2_FULL_48_7]
MVKLYHTDVRILENKNLSPDVKLLVFSNPRIAKESFPGKFISIDCSPLVFLRRPFCISGVSGAKIEIFYKVIGLGTRALSRRKKGEFINVLGPLGSGFPEAFVKKDAKFTPLFVAGGTGIAALRYLAQELPKPGVLFYGAKTKKEIPNGALEIFRKKKWQVGISTDDGTLGTRCTSCDLFDDYISRGTRSTRDHSGSAAVVFACGPKPMLKGVIKTAHKHGLKCFVSLEEKMACGLGACRGCVTKVRSPDLKHSGQEYIYKTICKDGPVFDSKELILE